jgi:hypothetical protein
VKFEKLECLTSESTSDGRLLTICNWDKYQNPEDVINKPPNKPLTNDQQAPNKPLTTNNNNKNYNKDKEEKFKSEVYEFLKLYPDAMLKEFISYWTEPNKSKTKMRYELQTTWDLARRLATWSRNDKNFNKDTKQVPAQKTYKSKNFDEFLKDPPDFIKNLTDKKTVKL